eukprot:6200691-Pleurochrysis_carterae.AAC.3
MHGAKEAARVGECLPVLGRDIGSHSDDERQLRARSAEGTVQREHAFVVVALARKEGDVGGFGGGHGAAVEAETRSEGANALGARLREEVALGGECSRHRRCDSLPDDRPGALVELVDERELGRKAVERRDGAGVHTHAEALGAGGVRLGTGHLLELLHRREHREVPERHLIVRIERAFEIVRLLVREHGVGEGVDGLKTALLPLAEVGGCDAVLVCEPAAPIQHQLSEQRLSDG